MKIDSTVVPAKRWMACGASRWASNTSCRPRPRDPELCKSCPSTIATTTIHTITPPFQSTSDGRIRTGHTALSAAMRAPSRALLQHLAARTATPASPLTWSLSSARSASRNGCAALVRPPSSPAAHAPSRRPHRPNGARAAGRLSSPWNVCARARQGPFQRPDGPLAQTAYSSTLQWPHGTQRRRYTTDVDVETGAAASPESMTAQERAVWEKVQKALQPEKLVVSRPTNCLSLSTHSFIHHVSIPRSIRPSIRPFTWPPCILRCQTTSWLFRFDREARTR